MQKRFYLVLFGLRLLLGVAVVILLEAAHPAAVSSQQSGRDIQHQALAVNIEVAVRVFKGNTFIDNLKMKDFEVYEDGVLQDIAAIYLVRKSDIERQELAKTDPPPVPPQTKRHFVLTFDVINWLPRIKEAMDHLFRHVLQPEDSLIVSTPIKTYRLTQAAIQRKTKEQICSEFTGLLRHDIIYGNLEYKSLIRDLKSAGRTADFLPSSPLLTEALFRKIRDYKYFDERRFQDFAEYLKDLEGQKHVFFFYQKEEIPIPKHLAGSLELMSRDTTFDVDRIKRIFSDSTITTHFLFLTKQLEGKSDVETFSFDDKLPLSDQSYAIFKPFHEITKATGGMTTASANAFSSFKQTAAASQNYYLLYYSPKNYRTDGGFRKIKIRVKSGKYRILHRAGYIAD